MKHQESFSKFDRAKRKVEKLKSFYNHLVIYLIINSIITVVRVYDDLDSWSAFTDELFTINVLSTWVIWGFVLGIHAFAVFVFPKIIGYDWEERQIEKIMNEELNSKRK